MKELNNRIKRKVLDELGSNFFINEINTLKGSNKLDISLNLTIPKTFYDLKNNQRYIRFIKYKNVHTIQGSIDKESNIKLSFDKNRISENIDSKEKVIKAKIENIILDEIYPKLINISLVKDHFRPIYSILHTIFTKHKFEEIDLKGIPNNKKERVKKYLKFLSEINIIRKLSKEETYIQGNIPIQIQEALKTNDESSVLSRTFGFILKNHRKYLKDQLNLRMLDPYIKVITTYYFISKNIGKPIEINSDYLSGEYKEFYGSKIGTNKLSLYLEDLYRADVLNKEENNYLGNASLLAKISCGKC